LAIAQQLGQERIMQTLIEAKNLRKRFHEVTAVDDVSLHVSAGEIYGLVGQDGAGKTTTMRLLCGAYLPDAGEQEVTPLIEVGGYDVIRRTEQARSQIGYLPQRFSLYEELTVMENIRFFAEVRGLSAQDWQPRCMEILEFVGLEPYTDRRAGNLSGGMKQKLGLAAALVHRPRVLLLDEPTTGVDPVTRQDFWQLIIRLVGGSGEQGTAVLVSTPYMDEAARCTRIGFMSRGSLIAEGSPAELCARLEGRVLELIGQPLATLRRLVQEDADVEDVQMFGDRLHLRVRAGQPDALMERLQGRITSQDASLDGLRVIMPQLEDVFMSLTEVEA
jgi:ABC-2 type transport system ATP-binding protein